MGPFLEIGGSDRLKTRRRRGIGRAVAALALLGLAAPQGANAAPPAPWSLELAEPIGHRDLAPEHAALARPSAPAVAPSAPLLTGTASSQPAVKREVFGYVPYWEHTVNAPYTPARWDLITVLAWFSVEMSATGTITNWRGWGGANTGALVTAAHAHGVKVVVTVTNFTNSEIGTLVNSAQNRARAIESVLDAIALHNADGVNIDFEYVPVGGRAGFVTFMADLKAAVAQAAPNGHAGHVTLAGPAVDWSGAYDYRALLEHTDGIMVMAYGYHWSGSNPGPNSPLYGGAPWPRHAIAWTVDDYLEFGGEENRHKVIIGLPWYGRNWPVPNAEVPTTSSGSGSAVFYRAAEAEVDGFGRMWNEQTRSSYYHKTVSGQLRQVWYDDHRAFAAKVAYVDERDLGGIGIWALGYEGTYLDLWDAIDEHFVVVPEDPGPEPGPEPLPEVAVAEPDEEPIADTDPAGEHEAPDEGQASPETTGPEVEVDGAQAPQVGRPLRDVHARRIVEPGGCAGARGHAGDAAPLGVGLAFTLAFAVFMRRRRLHVIQG